MNAAHGFEQDVQDLIQRANLPLPSNFLIDYLPAFLDNHHARTLKANSHMSPKFADVRIGLYAVMPGEVSPDPSSSESEWRYGPHPASPNFDFGLQHLIHPPLTSSFA